MAYGKIKADTLVYDNNGSDVEKTIASLAASAPTADPTFTGTATFNNLTVNGTTTTINSTTLTVDDKNIVLGDVSSPSDTTADGGGITLKGASDKTFNWVDATDAWTSSEHIHLGDNKKLLVGTGSDLQLMHDGLNSYVSDQGTGGLKILTSELLVHNQGGNETQIKATENGAVELYHDNSKKIETTAAGVTVTGSVTDDKGVLRNIPVISQTSGYTLVVGDAGKVVANTTGGWTIPANTFTTVGQVVTLLNNSGSDQTITASALTYLYNTADGANIKASTVTLGARGMATIWFDGGATGYIQSSFLTVS